MACTLPLATVMSMSRLATTPGNRLVIPRSSTAGGAVLGPIPAPDGEPVSLGVVMASLLALGGLLGGRSRRELPQEGRRGPGRTLSRPTGPVEAGPGALTASREP